MKNKLMKSLFIFGLGLGIATTASAGRFDNCNDWMHACDRGDQTSCNLFITECLM
jgi:hypothetical protein